MRSGQVLEVDILTGGLIEMYSLGAMFSVNRGSVFESTVVVTTVPPFFDRGGQCFPAENSQTSARVFLFPV